MLWQGLDIPLLKHPYNCVCGDKSYKFNDPILVRIARWVDRVAKGAEKTDVKALKGTERSIEIPLAMWFLENCVKEKAILELGCTLPYYIFKKKITRCMI